VPPLDLRGIVATARAVLVRTVTEDPESALKAEEQGAAAALLAELAAVGIPEADPSTWYGVAGASSDAALWDPDAVVPVSPSKVETVTTCALRWAFESAGGTAADDQNQTLGTLVHAVAEALPAGSLHGLKAELDRRWPQLVLPPGWPARQLRRRAEQMIEHLAEYLAQAGEPLAVEAAFDVEVGRARLRGKVDRIENAGDGAGIVADLKTGRSVPTVAKATTHAQLGAYQLAVDAGAVEGVTTSAGARLVYVGTDNKKYVQRTQPALGREPDGTTWAGALVEGAADTMASARFAAHTNDLCSMCPVRRSCPLQPEGRQVVA
jgi:RecB family exonuclease